MGLLKRIDLKSTNLLAFFAILIFLSGCSRNPVTGKKELMLVSESQEKAMGLQSDPSIIATYGVYKDDQLQAFINEKGKAMGAISHRPDLDYTFRVLDSPVVNAFAVPGGYVYFTRGIMAHFNNEAEFAGVLGHEIGHITARHSAAQLSKQQAYGLGLGLGMIFSPMVRQFGDIAQQGLGLMFLKFGRDDESQSDELGVSYSTAVGYDAHYMADFFGVLDRMQKSAGVNIPEWQSTHPNPANRFQRVHQLADKAQQGINRAGLKVNRDSYLALIDGIVYGEDPRQGFVENNNFYHPELKFQFPLPRGWQTVNTPTMLQMGEPNGKALMVMSLAQGTDLNAAAKTSIEQDQLQVQESAQVNVNGNEAIAMISVQETQNQQSGQVQRIKVLSYFILYNNLIYRIHGLSTEADFNSYFNTMQNTMKNFRTLHDQEKLNRQPERIKVMTANRTQSLQNFLTQQNVRDANKLEEIAVLNNMTLEEQLKTGDKYKMLVTGTSTSTN